MSDTESRKSMDDVLASIRRIVRAEKDPETVQEAEPIAPDPGPVDGGAQTVDEAEPLALTPEMRMGEDVAAQAAVPPADPAPLDSAPVAPVVDQMGASLDQDAIRAMVREVVLEQLGGPDGDSLIRGVIRDELTTGEIGSNISQNVMRLIQSEIGKALAK